MRKLAAGLAVAVLSAIVFAWHWHATAGHPDFDQMYAGALALRHGLNPYAEVCPGCAFDWPAPLYYPLPALLLVVPLTSLPIRVAGSAFVAVGGLCLGCAIERRGDRSAYLILLSGAFINCVVSGQWSLLLLAALWLPAAGVVGVAKPNVVAIVASGWTRARDAVWAVGGAVALVSASFALRPHWLGEWRQALGAAPWQHSPVLYPGGFLALAALVKWRRPEARVLAAYALIPQTPTSYSDLLLFAVPRGRLEFGLLAAVTYATAPLLRAIAPADTSMVTTVYRYGAVSAVLLMLPCVLMVLRRPNVN